MSKFFNKEVKLGLIFVVVLFFIIFGINFLKGINIFTTGHEYTFLLEDVNGLAVSNSVYIKGYKVGQISKITYDFKKKSEPFTINITINDDIKLPKGTKAAVFDENIMGGKAVDLVCSTNNDFLNSGDTIKAELRPGLTESLNQLVPKLETSFNSLNQTIDTINQLLGSQDIRNTLTSVDQMTTQLNSASNKLNTMMEHKIPEIIDNINGISNNFKDVSKSLSSERIDTLYTNLNNTVNNLQTLTNRLSGPEGTIGQLINNDSLYNKLNSTVDNANKLLYDLKENPKRYVHFSIWGNK